MEQNCSSCGSQMIVGYFDEVWEDEIYFLKSLKKYAETYPSVLSIFKGMKRSGGKAYEFKSMRCVSCGMVDIYLVSESNYQEEILSLNIPFASIVRFECNRCSHDRMMVGKFWGQAVWLPYRKNYFTSRKGLHSINGIRCLRCGYVQLYANSTDTNNADLKKCDCEFNGIGNEKGKVNGVMIIDGGFQLLKYFIHYLKHYDGTWAVRCTKCSKVTLESHGPISGIKIVDES